MDFIKMQKGDTIANIFNSAESIKNAERQGYHVLKEVKKPIEKPVEKTEKKTTKKVTKK